eukprot:TRINITY_DN3693_c0_g1_i10.p1 TRINITY_DN3693_c0_g1~~TRINITY_DN3693_c0_g1_i10.p1  ORF type:complete len:1984 (+),score=537.31 TRINITY_DN3693_c0_g1_i10:89-6040(+)
MKRCVAALCSVAALLTLLVSTFWLDHQVLHRPRAVTIDASPGRQRLLIAIDTVSGNDRSWHDVQLQSGRCYALSGVGQETMVASTYLTAVTSSSASDSPRYEAEIDHLPPKEIVGAFGGAPLAGAKLSCRLDVTMDLFRTGLSFDYSYALEKSVSELLGLTEKEADNEFSKVSFEIAAKSPVVSGPSLKMRNASASAQGALRIRLPGGDFTDILANFFAETPVYVKGSIDYAEQDAKAVAASARMDCKAVHSQKDDGSLMVSLPFEAAGNVRLLPAAGLIGKKTLNGFGVAQQIVLKAPEEQRAAAKLLGDAHHISVSQVPGHRQSTFSDARRLALDRVSQGRRLSDETKLETHLIMDIDEGSFVLRADVEADLGANPVTLVSAITLKSVESWECEDDWEDDKCRRWGGWDNTEMSSKEVKNEAMRLTLAAAISDDWRMAMSQKMEMVTVSNMAHYKFYGSRNWEDNTKELYSVSHEGELRDEESNIQEAFSVSGDWPARALSLSQTMRILSKNEEQWEQYEEVKEGDISTYRNSSYLAYLQKDMKYAPAFNTWWAAKEKTFSAARRLRALDEATVRDAVNRAKTSANKIPVGIQDGVKSALKALTQRVRAARASAKDSSSSEVLAVSGESAGTESMTGGRARRLRSYSAKTSQEASDDTVTTSLEVDFDGRTWAEKFYFKSTVESPDMNEMTKFTWEVDADGVDRFAFDATVKSTVEVLTDEFAEKYEDDDTLRYSKECVDENYDACTDSNENCYKDGEWDWYSCEDGYMPVSESPTSEMFKCCKAPMKKFDAGIDFGFEGTVDMTKDTEMGFAFKLTNLETCSNAKWSDKEMLCKKDDGTASCCFASLEEGADGLMEGMKVGTQAKTEATGKLDWADIFDSEMSLTNTGWKGPIVTTAKTGADSTITVADAKARNLVVVKKTGTATGKTFEIKITTPEDGEQLFTISGTESKDATSGDKTLQVNFVNHLEEDEENNDKFTLDATWTSAFDTEGTSGMKATLGLSQGQSRDPKSMEQMFGANIGWALPDTGADITVTAKDGGDLAMASLELSVHQRTQGTTTTDSMSVEVRLIDDNEDLAKLVTASVSFADPASGAKDLAIAAGFWMPNAGPDDDFQNLEYKTDLKYTNSDTEFSILSVDTVDVNGKRELSFEDTLSWKETPASGKHLIIMGEKISDATNMILHTTTEVDYTDSANMVGACVIGSIDTGDFEDLDLTSQEDLMYVKGCSHWKATSRDSDSAYTDMLSVESVVKTDGKEVSKADFFLTTVPKTTGADWLPDAFTDMEIYLRFDGEDDDAAYGMMLGVAGSASVKKGQGNAEYWEALLGVQTKDWKVPELTLAAKMDTTDATSDSADRTLGVEVTTFYDCDGTCEGQKCKSIMRLDGSLKSAPTAGVDAYAVKTGIAAGEEPVDGQACKESFEAVRTVASLEFTGMRSYTATADKYVGALQLFEEGNSELGYVSGLLEDTGSKGTISIKVKEVQAMPETVMTLGGILPKTGDMFEGDVDAVIGSGEDAVTLNVGVGISDGFVGVPSPAGVTRLSFGVAINIEDAASVDFSTYLDVGPVWDNLMGIRVPQIGGLGLYAGVYELNEEGKRDTSKKIGESVSKVMLPYDATEADESRPTPVGKAREVPQDALVFSTGISRVTTVFSAPSIKMPEENDVLQGVSEKAALMVPDTSFTIFKGHKELPDVPQLPKGLDKDTTTTSTPSPAVSGPVIVETVVELAVAMTPDAYDETAMLAAAAEAAGVDAGAVEVETVKFEMAVGYSFDADINEAQATTAVAKANNVKESEVEVTITKLRRLRATQPQQPGRRLAGTQVDAKIVVEDQEKAKEIVKTNTATGGAPPAAIAQLTTALKEEGVADVTPTQTKPPATTVKPVLKIKSEEDKKPAIAATESADTSGGTSGGFNFAESLAAGLGVEVEVTSVEVVTTPAPDATPSEDMSSAPGVSTMGNSNAAQPGHALSAGVMLIVLASSRNLLS